MIKNNYFYWQIRLFILFILLPTLAWSAPSNPVAKKITTSSMGKVHIVISGIKNNVGMMRIGLFNNSDAYSDMRRPAAPLAFKKGSAPIKNLQSEITFLEVPYGVYAVKLFQDELMVGKLKRNIFGKPLEGVGISNNPQIKTKLPSWERAQFIVNKPTTTIYIQMQNF